jgi:putative protein kinase ArgK-like GTPase of G3E family
LAMHRDGARLANSRLTPAARQHPARFLDRRLPDMSSANTRLILVGGFLGAGKMTLLRQAAIRLADRGRHVALLVNDQAADLADIYRKQAEEADVFVLNKVDKTISYHHQERYKARLTRACEIPAEDPRPVIFGLQIIRHGAIAPFAFPASPGPAGKGDAPADQRSRGAPGPGWGVVPVVAGAGIR